MKIARLLCLLALLVPATSALAQSGKIAGVVTEAATGEPLPGVNVVIDGTTQGAVTDVEGYYVILNVRPGTYDVRASFIGYTPEVASGVRVNIDLTTELDFGLREEAVGLDEVTVVAERPVVQRDVSASVANLNAQDIENLPVTDVEKVVGLQAGFERGLTVRGSGGNQVSFRIDGLDLGGGLDQTPFTGVSYTATEEVQVQTGGFSAKYGNVRSGLINVVTKEGSRDRYSADAIVRYSPPSEKYFGILPNDEESYFARPYFDDEVAMVGTKNGPWDQYTQDQYPEFVGWDALAKDYGLNTDDDPTNDVTAAQMQEAYAWYLRKDFEIDVPDYEVDATIGGPVPLVSRHLGDLRFTASYRQTQNAFIVPMLRDSYDERTFQSKVTANISQNMKLNVQGLYAVQQGLNDNEVGWQNMYTGDMPFYPWDDNQSYLANNVGGQHIFASHWRNPMDINRWMVGGQFTHTLSPSTFYEVQIKRQQVSYSTFTTPERDRETILKTVGSIELTEEPFGWEWRDAYDALGVGLRTGGHWFSARDSTQVTDWTGRLDFTSQLNRYSMLEAGVEYNYSNYDTNFGEVDPAHPHHANPKFVWNRAPQQGALYATNKLEFKGMVANLGLRLDYFHAGGEWYSYDAFDRAFSAQQGREALEDSLVQEPIGRQLGLSPRVGVSFPITDASKLYFNYGHFRQRLNPVDLFTIQEINTGAVTWIGNPNHPMPKTVAYELGYEQSVFGQYLIRLAGFYRDLSQQPRGVSFQSIDGEVNYRVSQPLNYGDVRGLEATLQKNRGDWVRGWVNYTYLASKWGNFGLGNVYQNRVEQRQYELTTTEHYQGQPVPEPFARFNVEVLLPEQLGPEVLGTNPLGDWRISFLGEWRKGQSLTWTGQQLVTGRSPVRGIQGNVRYKDFYNLDLRFSKNFNTAVGDAQFFVDVTNVLNLRNMNRYSSFLGNRDFERYMKSLHLPEDAFAGKEGDPPYQWVPGNDQPGDFREPGVEYVPIEVGRPEGGGNQRALYYDGGEYYEWNGSAFVEADNGLVERVLDDKAYIDMPNNTSFTFLNPRNVFFGLRITL